MNNITFDGSLISKTLQTELYVNQWLGQAVRLNHSNAIGKHLGFSLFAVWPCEGSTSVLCVRTASGTFSKAKHLPDPVADLLPRTGGISRRFLQLLGALETDSRCWSPEVTGMRIRRMKKHFCKRLLDLDILNILILQSTDNADCRFGLLQGCKAQVWLWIGVFSNELMFLSGRPIHQKATYHVYRFTHACPSLFVYRISRMVSGGTSSWQSFNTLGIIHADWTGDISWLKTAHLEQCFCLMQSNESC